MLASTQSAAQTTARKRRKMTIEEALRWAIRDELPKRREDRPIRGPQCAHDPIWRMGVFGSPIDCWNREPGMPPAMGDPHPDALLIEGQLNVLCETLTRAAANEALCPLDVSPYPIDDRLLGKADMGVLVATALHATPRWLYTCAINGTRPDVGEGPVCGPVLSTNGKITLWRTEQIPCGTGPDGKPWFTSSDVVATSKGDARDVGLFCKLKWSRTGVEWIEEQLRHAFWHAALVYLVPGLQFLTSIEALPPKAPVAPWLEAHVEEIAPLTNVRSARRTRLMDRLCPGRSNMLEERRPAGRRTVRRRASPVRQIDPATWTAPGERRA